ncbi:unnamed protein product, partial [Bubo scandiacus]
GIPSPSLPLYISSVPAATLNDQCHAEDLGPWKGSSTTLGNAAQKCTTALLSETRLQLPTFEKL